MLIYIYISSHPAFSPLFFFPHPSREHARERTSLISIAWETFNMQFLFDISHLVLIRMNASLYKGRHVHTSTYTLLPVDSSKSGNLFFFSARKAATYFSCPAEHSLVQSSSSPRFSSVYIRVGETEEGRKKQRRGMGGSSEDNDDNDDTIGTLLEHSLWENGGKAGWLVSNEFAGRVLSMYP